MAMDDSGIDFHDPRALFGRTILIGFTYLNEQGEVDRQEQYIGRIESIGSDGWMNIERDGVSVTRVPCDATAMRVAAKGTYRLRSTGEEVVDPDILSTWTIYPPKRH
jgi:hypothetical protein